MNTPRAFPPLAPNLRDFVLDLGDPVLVLDAAAQVVLANPASRQLMGAAIPPLPAPLAQVVGRAAGQRVQALLLDAAGGAVLGLEPLPLALSDGRSVRARLHRLDPSHWALGLRAPDRPSLAGRTLPGSLDGSAARELIGMFWDSPFPATLQDESFRLVAVNDAFEQFSGRPRESLIGLDPVLLMPDEDRAAVLEQREELLASLRDGELVGLVEQRMVDPAGRERWFRTARRALNDDDDHRLFLAVLQDCSAEHAAREQADRSERDLEHWFDMSPLGMVLYDGSGLLVRTNPAFESLAGAQPISLAEASAALQQLMAWEREGPSEMLLPGAPALRREGWLGRPGGGCARPCAPTRRRPATGATWPRCRT
jgi:PAS domain S-box-containing protein